MDKYTVDLDKVLNDFEYSEYSLENAKTSRNNSSNQEEQLTTPFHSNYSVRNDTTAKHSINTVFHSLNEYLSSEITPRNNTQSDNGAAKDSLSQPPNVVSIEEYTEGNSVFNDVNLPSSGNNRKDVNLDAFNDNLIEKTDILNDIVNTNINFPKSVDLEIEKDSLIDNAEVEIEKSDEKLEEDTLHEELNCNSVYDGRNVGNSTPDNLLVDLGFENDDYRVVNKANVSEEVSCCERVKDEYCDTDKSTTEDIIEEDNTILKDTEECGETLKIGFQNDIDIDEENLDRYFEEIEQEFGSRLQDSEMEGENLTEKEEIGNEGKPVSNFEDFKETEDEKVVEELIKKDEVEEDEKEDITKADNDEQEANDENSELSKIKKEKVVELESTDCKIEETQHVSSNEEITEDLSKENRKNEEIKNSRPQNLVLTDEKIGENSRKIDLVGEPGSTPFNNVYSTKEFGQKENIEITEPKHEERPVSPTYSDQSTDSVSSSTSEDTVYKDAVSEIANKNNKEEIEESSEEGQREEIRNNLLTSGDNACKNDVKSDKNFKDNLKMMTERGETSSSTTSATSVQEGGDNCVSSGGSSSSNVPREKNSNNDEETTGQNVSDENASSVVVEDTEFREQQQEQERRRDECGNSLGIDWLGKQAPLWIPDNEATGCLHCDMKFTVIKRRHHCRACGLVLCSKCCNLKYRLDYLENEARVCKKCYDILNKDTNSSSGSEISAESQSHHSPNRNSSSNVGSGQPSPNNPLEYCSTIPPEQQVDPGATATPSVMVPVGVLKRKGSNKSRGNKSVMFCDGIRPGSDLTNLDNDFNYSEQNRAEKSKRADKIGLRGGKNCEFFDPETRSFIPGDETCLPPTVTIFKSDVKYSSCVNGSSVVEMLRNESLIFALHSNVFVHVKLINMDCCVSKNVWCFSTEGLINVGQDEIVILLETIENESCVPKEIFVHLNNIYLEAVKGSSVKELGLSLHPVSPFLGSKNHAGFVYIRPTFQCLLNLIIPKEPYLIGILIHRWETPWAKLFPLRLILRLGAEYKYYPSPVISTRERDSVFVEVGHTIINLLADFRNFSYTLPQIRGLTIHMEDKNTTVTIPKNRHDQVIKGLSNSSDHILAFAGNFSTGADSHLVCIQDTRGATNNYSTHAINICNQPRKVTGASFIVFNGALKSTSGLTAKSNIVEDGLMIQILPEHMLEVRESLKNMRDHTIKCGCVNEESDETVTILWGEPDASFNVDVLSPIDNKSMNGIPSIRVHNGKDYVCNSGNRLIRWTEVFIVQGGGEETNYARNQEPIDISKVSENISKATCQALVKYLDLLVSNSFYKIGLRANVHMENVSYSAGSNNVKLPPIYMKSLDNELIPVLHRITSTNNNSNEKPIVLELIFRILNV